MQESNITLIKTSPTVTKVYRGSELVGTVTKELREALPTRSNTPAKPQTNWMPRNAAGQRLARMIETRSRAISIVASGTALPIPEDR